MSEQKNSTLQSPCIRNCCLDEQDICLGCFRALNEIVGWIEKSDAEKQRILKNCEMRKEQRSSK